MIRRTSTICAAFMLLLPAAVMMSAPEPALAATACENLATVALPNAKISSAQVVAAGAFTPPAGPGRAGVGGGGGAVSAFSRLPAFCRVTATLTPSSDSDIKTEIWLPASGWNGKFLAVGNGGWAGTIPYPAMAAAVQAGYAGAGTDTGHVGNSADFALGHPEKLVDFAHRSIHEMTVQSKAVITAHYGTAPKPLVLQRMLAGWQAGPHRGPTIPGRFQRHHRRRSAWNYMRSHGTHGAESDGQQECRQRHSAEQVSDDPRQRY